MEEDSKEETRWVYQLIWLSLFPACHCPVVKDKADEKPGKKQPKKKGQGGHGTTVKDKADEKPANLKTAKKGQGEHGFM